MLKIQRSLEHAWTEQPISVLAAARKHLEESPFLRIDYLELVDAETLQPIGHIKRPATLATAVFYGDVRLIDHVTLLP
jgi:pantothenate synthetase